MAPKSIWIFLDTHLKMSEFQCVWIQNTLELLNEIHSSEPLFKHLVSFCRWMYSQFPSSSHWYSFRITIFFIFYQHKNIDNQEAHILNNISFYSSNYKYQLHVNYHSLEYQQTVYLISYNILFYLVFPQKTFYE